MGILNYLTKQGSNLVPVEPQDHQDHLNQPLKLEDKKLFIRTWQRNIFRFNTTLRKQLRQSPAYI